MDWDPLLCRICLISSKETVDLRNPFKENELCWQDILNICTSLDVKQNDDLPTKICQICCLELKSAFNFYKKANRTDRLLRNLYEPFNLKIELNEEDTLNMKAEEKEVEMSEEDTNIIIGLDVIQCRDDEEFSPKDFQETSLEFENNQIENLNEKSEIYEHEESSMAIEATVRMSEIKDKICCSECGESFGHSSNLDQHIRLLHCGPNDRCDLTKELIECDLCGKNIKRKSSSYHKMRFHSGDKSFLCNACPKSFFTLDNLKTHLKTHDKKRERNFVCNICSKAFLEKRSLLLHEQRHTGIKQFQCLDCGQRFFTRKALENHSIVHNRNIGKHECNVCGKKFTSKGEVVIHMRFHTGIFPYKCDLCDRSFAVKSHYNYHIAKHNGVVYDCPHCSKQFTNRGSLTCHILKHRDKIPHPCPICNKGYRTPFKLKKHMQIHQNKSKKSERMTIENNMSTNEI